MASRKRCLQSQHNDHQMFRLLRVPQSSKDVLVLLKLAAEVSPANTEIVAHLTEMGMLFPDELLGAFRAFLKRQISDN
jgi:hypothetical protein